MMASSSNKWFFGKKPHIHSHSSSYFTEELVAGSYSIVSD